MKFRYLLQRLIMVLTGFLFAVYAAYNVFVIVRDSRRGLSNEGKLISGAVALMFALLAVFVWTGNTKTKNIRWLKVRRVSLIIALGVILLLKLRMVVKVIDYLDFSQAHTILYGAAYLMTVAALLLLFIYFVFILKKLPFHPRAAVALPTVAMILFLLSLAIETILFFVYGIGMEANVIRTIVIRPVFYLGFVGLCVYFLMPSAPVQTKSEKAVQTESEKEGQ